MDQEGWAGGWCALRQSGDPMPPVVLPLDVYRKLGKTIALTPHNLDGFE